MVERSWRYFLYLLAAHHPEEKLDHTIHITVGRKSVYLCSRCTGIAVGILGIFGASYLGLAVPTMFTFPLIGLLPLFAVSDWFTQSARLRQSNTGLRVGSGFLLGISEGLSFLLLFSGNWQGFLAAVGMAAIYAVSVYLIASKTKCLRAYLKELNQIG